MCWSLEVSLKFAFAHFLAAVYVAWHRPPHMRYFLSFISFYLAMELLQALEWFTGVESHLNQTCTNTNTFLTIIAYIFIWLQPVLFASFATKHDSRFVWYYSLYTLVAALFNLILGFCQKAIGLELMSQTEKTNYGQHTCTYRGEGNHLVWKFSVPSFNYQPTHYVYFSIILLTIIFHFDRILQFTIGIGWLTTFFLSLFIIGGVNAELTSYWCLLSIFADIPIIIYTMLYARNKSKQKIN
ncbi:hypothetical protein I4U23_002387 [Adineta vaga]|nr:hypothetical protein I4U23_002387 [Adineta vaga]